jgi:transcriptional regulator with XRE-family HTH domain
MSIEKNRKIRNIEKIIERMWLAIGATNKKGLAKYLGLKQNSISSWEKQDTVPYKHIDIISENTNKPFEYFLNDEFAEAYDINKERGAGEIATPPSDFKGADDREICLDKIRKEIKGLTESEFHWTISKFHEVLEEVTRKRGNGNSAAANFK